MPIEISEQECPAVNLDMARQILEQGNHYMAAQLQCAIASDQRATASANIFVAAAAAAFGVGAAHYGATANLPVLLGIIVTGVFLLLAAYFNFHAARPMEFYYPGNYPSQWWPHATADLALMIGGETENYDERIRFNAQVLHENGRWQKLGNCLGLIAPAAGLLTWILASRLWSQAASLPASPSL